MPLTLITLALTTGTLLIVHVTSHLGCSVTVELWSSILMVPTSGPSRLAREHVYTCIYRWDNMILVKS